LAAVRVWRMFPFDLSNFAFDRHFLARWPLLVVIVGSVTGLIVNVIARL
jgi:hypothetical protein